MSLSEELRELGALHERGVLSGDEFTRAKARVINTHADSQTERAVSAVNALRRSRSDRWLGGVCGGLAHISGFATWAWRALFTLLVLCAGTGVVVYLLLWLLVPQEDLRDPLQASRAGAG